jgi:hypothetical protein
MTADYELDRAYEIHGPEDAKKLYDGWAETYDDSFGKGWGYVAPRRIAEIFLAEAGDGAEPILDIGAGTGLVAEALPGLTSTGSTFPPTCWRGPRRRASTATASSAI